MLNKKIIKFGAGIFLAGALSGGYYFKNSENFSQKSKSIERVVLNEETKNIGVENKIEEIRRKLNNGIYFKKDNIDDIIYWALRDIRKNSFVPDYISPKYIRAVIKVESSDCKNLVSKKDAKGCMQLIKEAWEEVEKNRDYDKYSQDNKVNIKVGINYLNWLNKRFENNYFSWSNLPDYRKQELLSSAYNGGFEGLRKNNFISKYNETKLYVKKVKKELKKLTS